MVGFRRDRTTSVLVGIVLGSMFPAFALDITLNVASPLTLATSLNVQAALNNIASSGGGTLQFTGAGSLLVTSPLLVGSNTTVMGDTSRTPYGMIIIGENTAGLPYRDQPIFRTLQTSTNITFWNLEFDGNARPLCAPAIDLGVFGIVGLDGIGTQNVVITHVRIGGARTIAIAALEASSVQIRYLSLEMRRHTNAEPEGGAGVWLWFCTNCILEHSEISGPEFYWAGPPSNTDSRVPPAPPSADPVTDPRGRAPSMDLVSLHDGFNNKIQHNTISYGNTAGIYLAKSEFGNGDRYGLVWNNTVHHFRQHGIDLADSANLTVRANRVYDVEQAGLSLANSPNTLVEHNSIRNGGRWGGTNSNGNFTLSGSSNVQIRNNEILAGNNPYAVFFWGRPGFPLGTGSSLTKNTLSRNPGSADHISGDYAGWNTSNVVSPNTLCGPSYCVDKIGVSRPSGTNRSWLLDKNGNGIWNGQPPDMLYGAFGIPGDLPVRGDWDGSGIFRIGVYRQGWWLLDINGNGVWDGSTIDRQTFFGGVAGDVPVTGRWNGLVSTQIGVYRPSLGSWFLDSNGNGTFDGQPIDVVYQFGNAGQGDVPIVGDWDGDGRTNIGIWRSIGGGGFAFYLDRNGNGVWNNVPSDRYYVYGQSGDLPVAGDWSGSGNAKIGVLRIISGLAFWLVDFNGNGVWENSPADRFYQFGIDNDTPVAAAWGP